jgi:erythronate-4-phosphate dehydrogenase
MKILVDENVPYGREAFETIGEVTLAPGRAIDRGMLSETDVLIVRSITKVNHDLLDGTPVKFAGTCTIGEDHIDKAWLAQAGIGFSSAPGCNANSVGQYITAALLHLMERYDLFPGLMKLGVVGVGNVGRRVVRKARAIGFECLLNDPPLFDETGDPVYRSLDEILHCDIITLHVPLEKAGRYPTYHLADEAFLDRMKPGAILINSARGTVADNAALKKALREEHLRAAVLDVWEGEPEPDLELLQLTDIATPHIAGYSFDGKVNGTRQIFEAACAHLNIDAQWDPAPLLPEPEVPEITIDPARPAPLARAVSTVYDIMRDDAAMRGILDTAPEDRAAFFDGLRKYYPRRREFFNTRVRLTSPSPELEERLAGIGFRVSVA